MSCEVTVVIPNYNSGRYLADAVKSVIDQTLTEWSIIVVDDGSTDNSLKIAAEYLKDHRVGLVRNDHNIGQSKSMNKGLELTDTPYLVQLDSDDMFFPNTLEDLVAAAKSQPKEVAVLNGKMLLVVEDAQGRRKKSAIREAASFSDRYEFLLANRSVFPRFYRTECLRKIGGWPLADPYRGRYAEDMQILYRLIEDYRIVGINELVYFYRLHSANQTNNRPLIAKSLEWVVRNALKRWGDQYEPVFETDEEGWKRVVKIIPK